MKTIIALLICSTMFPTIIYAEQVSTYSGKIFSNEEYVSIPELKDNDGQYYYTVYFLNQAGKFVPHAKDTRFESNYKEGSITIFNAPVGAYYTITIDRKDTQ